jgi:very-short-patch-repair endonuclease
MSKRRRTTQAVQVRARQLRREQTAAEARLWEQLRDHRLDGFKFRRQHPLGRFIADFYCPERRLIVEIDGEVHRDQADYDEVRTAALEAMGYVVVRWSNEQVEYQLPVVLDEIRRALRRSPFSCGGGRRGPGG